MKFTCEMFHPNSKRIDHPERLYTERYFQFFFISFLGRQSLHIDSTCTRWRSNELWIVIGTLESSTKCRENFTQCCINVSWYGITLGGEQSIVQLKQKNYFFPRISEPNDESGANVDAAIMWREQREEFNKIAKRIVRKTLGLPS